MNGRVNKKSQYNETSSLRNIRKPSCDTEREEKSEDGDALEPSHPVTPRENQAAADKKVFAPLFSKSGRKDKKR